MTKVVITMHVLQTEAKTKLGIAGRKSDEQREGSICTGFNMTAESRGSEDGKRQ